MKQVNAYKIITEGLPWNDFIGSVSSMGQAWLLLTEAIQGQVQGTTWGPGVLKASFLLTGTPV